MTKRQILNRLRTQVDAAGGMRAWSRSNGFSASFVSDVLAENVEPSKRLLLAIRGQGHPAGFERVKEVRYRPIGATAEAEAA